MSDPVTPMLAPHLVCDGAADAIDFYVKAFGATDVLRLPGPDGKLLHGRVEINGAAVLLVDANAEWGTHSPKSLGGSSVTLHLQVDDADRWVARAQAAGASVTMPPADMFWGDRYGIVTDPFGHVWSIATPLPGAPQTEAELREAAARAMPSAA